MKAALANSAYKSERKRYTAPEMCLNCVSNIL